MRASDGVGVALDQPRRLEGPQHLRGHHGVGAGVLGELALAGRAGAVLEEPGAGQQHELHVGEPGGLEGDADHALPAEGGVPQEEAGLLPGGAVGVLGGARSFDEVPSPAGVIGARSAI